jgi:Peptidase family M23/FG-GAP repeat
MRPLRTLLLALALLVAGAPAARAEGGVNEDANWLPLLGNFELWCTQGNPGYVGCQNHHTYPAMDIGMPVGTPVHASGPGVITMAGSERDARGVFVEIRHPDGIRSRYLHLSRVLVSVGQRVERGSVIARSGQTGSATSPHLHYEERNANGDLKPMGVMYALHGDRLVVYPNVTGYTSWNSTPYGTRLRNDGFGIDNTTRIWGGPGVATGDINGDGLADVVSGAPGEDTGPAIDGGALNVVYGRAGGATATGAEQLLADDDGVAGLTESNDVLGSSVATGDFDGDGFDDVALGAPGEAIGSIPYAGEVLVVYGSVDGLKPATRSQRWYSDTAGVAGVSERGDQFGAALAVGDFDGDTIDDLAVGAPGETIAGAPLAGAVTVLNGSASGLVATGSRQVPVDSEPGDRLGAALAAGDVNGDDIDDLAVGVPGEDVGAVMDAGAVVVLPRARAAGQVQLTAADRAQAGAMFGVALTMGDFDGDGVDDLATGAVGEDLLAGADAGVVYVHYGSAVGLQARTPRTYFSSNVSDVDGVVEARDRFGSGVGAGDVNGDGRDDLLVGIAGQDAGAATDAGAVVLLFGTALGLRGAGSFELTSDAEVDDALGASVAVGDVDGDHRADLVLGAPDENLPGAADAGATTVVYGVGPLRSAVFHADLSGIPGDAERGDRWSGLFPPYL